MWWLSPGRSQRAVHNGGRERGEGLKGEWSREMANPEAIRCPGRQLGCAESLPIGSRPWMLGKDPGTGHQDLEEMAPARAQPV